MPKSYVYVGNVSFANVTYMKYVQCKHFVNRKVLLYNYVWNVYVGM